MILGVIYDYILNVIIRLQANGRLLCLRRRRSWGVNRLLRRRKRKPLRHQSRKSLLHKSNAPRKHLPRARRYKYIYMSDFLPFNQITMYKKCTYFNWKAKIRICVAKGSFSSSRNSSTIERSRAIEILSSTQEHRHKYTCSIPLRWHISTSDVVAALRFKLQIDH